MNSKHYRDLRDYTDRLQAELAEQSRQIRVQRRYIAELEKQLEYCNPGIVKEVQEFLEGKEP